MRWLTRHRTGVTGSAAAVLVGVAGLTSVLLVQAQANQALSQSNLALTESLGRERASGAKLATSNAALGQSNTDLKDANRREAERFGLALDAMHFFHGKISEDLLLKEKSLTPRICSKGWSRRTRATFLLCTTGTVDRKSVV